MSYSMSYLYSEEMTIIPHCGLCGPSSRSSPRTGIGAPGRLSVVGIMMSRTWPVREAPEGSDHANQECDQARRRNDASIPG